MRIDFVRRRFGGFTKILRTDCGGRDNTKCFHILVAVVVKAVNGAPRNAECLSRPNIDLFSIYSPCQDSSDPVDRLLVPQLPDPGVEQAFM